MSNYPSQSEFDDELLSAYLDDELSPDERAAVENRLAADPAARELLEQLRDVARAVQGLPQDVVGHNLGATILRRVEQQLDPGVPPVGSVSKSIGGGRASYNGAPATAEHPVPTWTIGRTRRGWAWTSLAAAAAVLIMVFQPDREADQNLPAVAQRDIEPAAERLSRRRSVGRELELRPLNESVATSVTDLAASGLAGEPAEPLLATPDGSIALDGVVDQPPPSPSSLAFGRDPASDSLSAAASATATENAPSVPPGDAASARSEGAIAMQRPMSPATEREGELLSRSSGEQLVVVRVLARREALQQKAFDQLLLSNGIQFDPEESQRAAAAPAQPAPTSRYAESTDASGNAPPTAEVLQETANDDELVLVEAPSFAILGCMEGLNRDSQNYLGLAVDETRADKDSSDVVALKSTIDPAAPPTDEAKAPSELSLSKYNRGVVPRQQESRNRNRLYSAQQQPAYDYYAVPGGFGGGEDRRGGQAGTPENAALRWKQVAGANQGQAWRLRLGEVESQLADQLLVRARTPQAQSAAENVRAAAPQAGLRPATPANDGTFQVLFVLSPSDEPAASPPSRNKAQ